MKTRISNIFAACALALCTTAASAQGFNTGYFLDGYNYRYKLNPALDNENGFFGVGFADWGISMSSNVGLSTFIYPNGGKLTTALSPSVSSEQFLGKLNDSNSFNFDSDLSLLAIGFRKGNLYHTIDFSARIGASTTLPYDLFRFLKDGTQNGTSFDMSNISAAAEAYAQLAYGISAKINDNLKIGARIKLLSGLAYADAQYDKISLQLGEDQWRLSTHGHLAVSSGEITHTTTPSESGSAAIDHIEIKMGAPSGSGAAIDLGLSYEAIPGLTISAAVLDLGVVSWNKGITASTNSQDIIYTPAENIDINNPEAGFSSQINGAFDKIGSIIEFIPGKETGIRSSLGMTIHAGAEYRLPMYDKLSFGLLGTYKSYRYANVTEARLSANYSPVEWLSMSVSGAAGNMGGSFGAALNIHPKVINFFIGTDSYVLHVTPEKIPVNKANTGVRLGLDFSF